ncbi:MAG: RIP metalloprotease RseP [Solirubrobacterales bacterium]
MYVIYAIIAFSVLIIVHELGHFTMAKLNNVMVEEFSLGMGPKLYGIQGKETKYLIKAFPIGGYVKMLGDEGASTDPRAFNNKKPIQKLSIVIAGPIMNLILGVILFAMVSGFKGYYTPVIDKLTDNGPAKTAGLLPGDKLLKINSTKILTWEDFATDVYTSNGKPVTITYSRNNKVSTMSITPVKDVEQNRYMVGIYPTEVTSPSIIQSINYGMNESVSLTKQTAGFFKTLFTGKASMNDFGGPVTIIKYSGAAAKAGIITLMSFSAYISIQLAIFNIIPFPALDGGYIFLYLFEIITGRKVDDNKVGIINYFGFAVLMMLMVIVTIKDIIYPINI